MTDIDNVGYPESYDSGASIIWRVDIMCLRSWGVVVEDVLGSSSCWFLANYPGDRVR